MIKIDPITDREYGAVIVPRGWSEIFAPLLEKFDLNYHGFPNKPSGPYIRGEVYTTETNKFKITPGYDWECTCGAEEDGDLGCDHYESCDLLKPNFLYKPTGFKLTWYKYPMRETTMIPGITTKEFVELILDCLK